MSGLYQEFPCNTRGQNTVGVILIGGRAMLVLVCSCPAILRVFVYCICIIMMHSHLNDIEIPETKRFIPKGFEIVCRPE